MKNEFEKLGLEQGDNVLVHSSMHGTTPTEFYRKLKTTVGEEGTIIVPTFNYDFAHGVPYNHDTTPSQVGYFTNWMLGQRNAIRSFHPVYSFASMCKNAPKFLEGVSKEANGVDSVFDRLYKFNGKMLFYQCTFESCTFVHYVEQMFGADYRFRKYIKGTVTRDGKTWEEMFTFYAKFLNRNIINDFRYLASKLNSKTDDKSILVTCGDGVQKIDDVLTERPYGLLKQIPDGLEECDGYQWT